jgi:hypothetical protein
MQELAKHVEGITLLPDGNEIRYRDDWKLLGECNRDGAEGQS